MPLTRIQDSGREWWLMELWVVADSGGSALVDVRVFANRAESPGKNKYIFVEKS